MSWVRYWSTSRTDSAFWQRSVRHHVACLRELVGFDRSHRVLDYGAGPGFTGPLLAPEVGSVHLLEPSRELHAQAARRCAGLVNVTCHESSVDTLERLTHEVSFDRMIVNSVFQYVQPEEVARVLASMARGLAPGGRIVVSDLVPPGHSLLCDLLSVGRHHLAWLPPGQFVRYLVAELRRIPERRRLPLHRVTRESFEALAGDHFAVDWRPNPTVCARRECCVLARREEWLQASMT